MTFDELGLSPETVRAVADKGYTTPTPIQTQAIPQILMGRDLFGIAQTGTGKTAGFTLPLIDILAKGRAKARMPRSLILSPTRELAAQTAQNFDDYGKHQKLSKALLIGGESFTEQERLLDHGVDVLIATPGRLIDLFERGRVMLIDTKILVIDEADRMLDMGFIPDIERIVGLLPKIRQTLLFSATMPPEIKKLADKFLMNPKEVSVAPPASPAENVEQKLVTVDHRSKRAALREILSGEDVSNAFVFCNRKRDVSILFRSLQRHGFSAAQLHGDMSQPERTATLEQFKTGAFKFLICSDVAARGLDVPQVSHVFNFDVPTHPEDYVHRIGRTGRAGFKGRAYTIAGEEDGRYVAAIEAMIGKSIEPFDVEGVASISLDRSDTRRGRSRRNSRQKSAPSAAPPRSPARETAPAAEAETTATKPVETRQPRATSRRNDRRGGQGRGRFDDEIQTMEHGENEVGFGAAVPDFILIDPLAQEKAAAAADALSAETPPPDEAKPKRPARRRTPKHAESTDDTVTGEPDGTETSPDAEAEQDDSTAAETGR